MTPEHYAHRLRQLVLTLILVLTFEGILRKAAPPGFGVPLFLLKDFLATVMGYYVVLMPPAPALTFLWGAYKTLVVLFIPLFICTAWNDPLLAIFGAKQYLLFPMVGFGTFYAFQFARREEILRFFRGVALLIIPTALLALLQLRLPHDHWLNMSVGGESLEAFSAAGQLRVSSTFSFVAQYCAFLNAEAFMIMIALQEWKKQTTFWKILLCSLIPFLVISSFVTGSRGAVVGNMAMILLAGGLTLSKFQIRNVVQVCVIIAFLYVVVLLVNYYSPDATAAYSAREEGHLLGFSDEVRDRVWGNFMSMIQDKSMSTFFGNGLGIMSNGSDTFSKYAAQWRSQMWTETDGGTIFFEGGWYLALVWYGFRFYVIFITTRRYVKQVTEAYAVPAAFVQAFLIITGILGTLSTQPPIAIWWWMSVGLSVVFWWKCTGPPEPETKIELPPPPSAPRKLQRGRSLYADVLHGRK